MKDVVEKSFHWFVHTLHPTTGIQLHCNDILSTEIILYGHYTHQTRNQEQMLLPIYLIDTLQSLAIYAFNTDYNIGEDEQMEELLVRFLPIQIMACTGYDVSNIKGFIQFSYVFPILASSTKF